MEEAEAAAAVAEDEPPSQVSQMSYARVLNDPSLATSHPGDQTPRLLLIDGPSFGDYVQGRLLFSPWSAFQGVFPMHGTYFAQNEVFEDESAGKVRVPLAALGAEKRVYLGKSIEGVLRHRTAQELARLFRESYVCIRRFRSTDGRLLPLLLDPPRLLKNHAAPSELALQLGLAAPVPPAVNTGSSSEQRPPMPTPPTWHSTVSDEAVDMATDDSFQGAAASDMEHVTATDDDRGPGYEAQLARGLRLFKLYIAAGGALCMRPAIWRKLLPTFHPDKGGHTAVFQLLSDLKRRVDMNEEVEMPQLGIAMEDAEREDPFYNRLRDDLQSAAAVASEGVMRQVEAL